MVCSVSALVPHVSKGTALANVLRVSDAEVLRVPETLRGQRRPCMYHGMMPISFSHHAGMYQQCNSADTCARSSLMVPLCGALRGPRWH